MKVAIPPTFPYKALRVTQGEKGYRIDGSQEALGTASPPSFTCVSATRLRLLLQILGATEADISAIFKELECSVDAKFTSCAPSNGV